MVSRHFEEKFRKFCSLNNIKWNQKTHKWNKPFHPKTKNIWIPSENGDFLNSIRPKEKGYYDCTFEGWSLGDPKNEFCLWCGRIIPETRKNDPRAKKVKFCNSMHRKAFGKVKSDQEKLGKLFNFEK
ncbi:MAG: hypothetical protein COW27_01170 [Nitrosopumilales archaeon CG15_BIG_FIL_POST_REV_8_21_14_020_37_12]|nr:MAG: hypothetical protein COW27_01170 [Nitrosopumilales archaeon CG15_BIG_FIL_POST_REV_8_21_14_020_37_12]